MFRLTNVTAERIVFVSRGITVCPKLLHFSPQNSYDTWSDTHTLPPWKRLWPPLLYTYHFNMYRDFKSTLQDIILDVTHSSNVISKTYDPLVIEPWIF